ncbi:hypothetical protein L1889_04625 [Paenalcaligenes niemegkensis]|uniref:hypothetical protein n=1 Tax=Paenalcaligenes niemegkensis TaxID=2895469 RepID=UPI001EE84FD0|nr:hypothetical protein [Paenalcaligenes niemegkensis]MCQ9616078.1 hypothetical protein [Paenalcaligenes niemegkensis]
MAITAAMVPEPPYGYLRGPDEEGHRSRSAALCGRMPGIAQTSDGEALRRLALAGLGLTGLDLY